MCALSQVWIKFNITHQALCIVIKARPTAVLLPSPTDLAKCHYKSHSSWCHAAVVFAQASKWSLDTSKSRAISKEKKNETIHLFTSSGSERDLKGHFISLHPTSYHSNVREENLTCKVLLISVSAEAATAVSLMFNPSHYRIMEMFRKIIICVILNLMY